MQLMAPHPDWCWRIMKRDHVQPSVFACLTNRLLARAAATFLHNLPPNGGRDHHASKQTGQQWKITKRGQIDQLTAVRDDNHRHRVGSTGMTSASILSRSVRSVFRSSLV